MLATTAPKGVKAKTTGYPKAKEAYDNDPTPENELAMQLCVVDDVCFKGVIAFDFSMAGFTKSTAESKYLRQTTGSYDGIWTGVWVTNIFTVLARGERLCYCFAKTNDEKNVLYQLSRASTGIEEGKRIECSIETRSMPGKTPDTYVSQPFVYKKLEDIKIWIDDIYDEVDLSVFLSPDPINGYFKIGSFIQKAKVTASEPSPDGLSIDLGSPQSRGMLLMKDMTYTSEPTTHHPLRLGNEFQIRLVWNGLVTLRRLFLDMRQIEDPTVVTHEKESCSYPFATFDQYSYHINQEESVCPQLL
jgi:hypothetical protein